MSQTTPKIITLKQLYEEAGIEKYCDYKGFLKLWKDLGKMFIRDGLGRGKSVKMPFSLGTLKPSLYKPSTFKVDKQLSKKYNTEILDEWNELDGLKIKVLWFNAYNYYPSVAYLKFRLSTPLFKLLRQHTAIHKLTERR